MTEMDRNLDPHAPPFALWHLLQLVDEAVTAAVRDGNIDENATLATLVHFDKRELLSAWRAVVAWVVVSGEVRGFIQSLLAGREPVGVRSLRRRRDFDDIQQEARRIFEHVAGETDDPEVVEDNGQARGRAEEADLVEWCLEQFLALVIDAVTAASLSDRLAEDLLAVRLSHYTREELGWIFDIGGMVILVSGRIMDRLAQMREAPASASPVLLAHLFGRHRPRSRRRPKRSRPPGKGADS